MWSRDRGKPGKWGRDEGVWMYFGRNALNLYRERGFHLILGFQSKTASLSVFGKSWQVSHGVLYFIKSQRFECFKTKSYVIKGKPGQIPWWGKNREIWLHFTNIVKIPSFWQDFHYCLIRNEGVWTEKNGVRPPPLGGTLWKIEKRLTQADPADPKLKKNISTF